MDRKRNPIGAALLSLVMPGLGHLYSAQPKRAGVIYLLALSTFPVLSFTAIAFTWHGLMVLVAIGLSFLVFVMVDAARNARRLGIIALQKYNRWYVYACVFLAHAFLILPIIEEFFPRPVKAYRIPSGAMEPTLQIGDHIIVDLTHYARHVPQRGDVMVFVYPEDQSKDFIMRVIGLPGERVEIRVKKVLIDGQELPEGVIRLNKTFVEQRDNFGPVSVPDRQYFVLGDNRDHSYDTRFWGFVDRSLFNHYGLIPRSLLRYSRSYEPLYP